MNKEKRIAILTRLRDENPHPTTELNFTSPFELLIAVLLSAQATDVSVNKATALLYPVANTPKAMLELGVEGVKSYIKTIGLFNSKAENVIKTCRILLEQHGGEVPENRAALEALPGVGRKTANVVLNTAFGWPTIAVDTHIFRVSNRTNFAPGKMSSRSKRSCSKWFRLNLRWTAITGSFCMVVIPALPASLAAAPASLKTFVNIKKKSIPDRHNPLPKEGLPIVLLLAVICPSVASPDLSLVRLFNAQTG